MKLAIVFLLVSLISGCAQYQLMTTISSYEKVAPKIELGDSKNGVLNMLLPTQRELSSGHKKQPEKYLQGDVLVEIYYMRSSFVSDGLTTDDEFTPYIFKNGKLVGIGWASLGGAKSHGQATGSSSSGADNGLSFMCKNAIGSGDQGAINVHCN